MHAMLYYLDGEQYIRAESGRAAWKLAESDTDSAIEIEDVESHDDRDEGNVMGEERNADTMGEEEVSKEENIDEQQRVESDGGETGKEDEVAAVSQEEDGPSAQGKDREVSAEESVTGMDGDTAPTVGGPDGPHEAMDAGVGAADEGEERAGTQQDQQQN